jgi:hypothetical protein
MGGKGISRVVGDGRFSGCKSIYWFGVIVVVEILGGGFMSIDSA